MSEANVDVVRRLYELWNRRAFAVAIELYDPEIEYARIGAEVPDFAGAWTGVDEMRSAVRDYMSTWDDYQYEPQEFHDIGDRVLVRERHKGRGKRSGVAVDHDVGAVFTLQGGRVVRLIQYWDFAEARKAAGLPD